jgi:hypothetical protein
LLVPILWFSAIPGARDWKLDPAVVQIDTASDVYAVGDIHTDPQRPRNPLARRSRHPHLAAGGRVVILMGNHEAEHLAAYPNSTEFFSALPVGAGANDWFFSHAGNTGGRTLATLDADLRRAIDSAGFGSPELLGPLRAASPNGYGRPTPPRSARMSREIDDSAGALLHILLDGQ